MSDYIITGKAVERWDIPHVILAGEIVRCRDCIYFECLWTDCYVCKRHEEKLMPFVEPDGFCAWGERKC